MCKSGNRLESMYERERLTFGEGMNLFVIYR